MSFEFLSSYWTYLLAFISLSSSLVVALFTLSQHLLHYTSHRLQRYVVRILIFFPIHGVITFMMLCAPGISDVLEMLRNIWEGLLIHSFLCLMMEYCGGENACGERIANDPAVIRHLWPLHHIKFFSLNEDIPLNVGFVKKCRMGTMQYAMVRFALAVLVVLLHLFGYAFNRMWSFVFSFVLNLSVYSALYFLGLFYLAIRTHPGLAKANSVSKFFSLKLCFAFSFYQDFLIDILFNLPQDVSLRLKAFLILMEASIIVYSQRKAYCISEFYTGALPTTETPEVSKGVLDIAKDDFKTLCTHDGQMTMLESAKRALDISDLFQDTYYNISDKYRQHTLFTESTEASSTARELEDIATEVDSKMEDFADFAQVNSMLDTKGKELSKLQFI
ncbi:hypothetical protein BEWA_022440 [Theileria equi strain WA]|uniref:Transmembrane protein n=1 Tax=Theileria equi strain WA TaxID=1537102 RepID=L0AWK6_THEEQ|nr:hypothetical protein BEWA_022440 [Theileria equi strain WA]AFZ79396.1 hypothetical protein BEWA_022440 [Theileria equi strain WA]|eukprot:XP_004829062.1 hypothetical protein BEWA_022440 [Theileria equi strain WA]